MFNSLFCSAKLHLFDQLHIEILLQSKIAVLYVNIFLLIYIVIYIL